MAQNPKNAKVVAYYRKQRLNDEALAAKGDKSAQAQLKKISGKLSKRQRAAFLPDEVTNGSYLKKPGASEGQQMFNTALGLEGGVGAIRGILGRAVRGAGKALYPVARDVEQGIARRVAPRARVVGNAVVDDVKALGPGRKAIGVRKALPAARKALPVARKAATKATAKRAARDADDVAVKAKRTTPREKGTNPRARIKVTKKGAASKDAAPRALKKSPRHTGTNPRAKKARA